MITLKSPTLIKEAQEDPARAPWEFSPEEEGDLQPLGEMTPEGLFEQPSAQDFQQMTPEESKPIEGAGEVPPEVKPDEYFTYLPLAPFPKKDVTPVNPYQFVGEDIPPASTPIEEANKTLGVREMIGYSLVNRVPLQMTYTTLEGGNTIERMVRPDYIYWAGTGRHIMVAWDDTKGDWRAFSVNNISKAQLMEPTALES